MLRSPNLATINEARSLAGCWGSRLNGTSADSLAGSQKARKRQKSGYSDKNGRV